MSTNAFVHHVFFWLNNPESAEDRAALLTGLETLRGISTIRQSYIGTPAPTDRPVIDSSYAVSWLMLFDDAAGEEFYQNHPVHQAFIASCKHLWSKVVVYDALSTSK